MQFVTVRRRWRHWPCVSLLLLLVSGSAHAQQEVISPMPAYPPASYPYTNITIGVLLDSPVQSDLQSTLMSMLYAQLISEGNGIIDIPSSTHKIHIQLVGYDSMCAGSTALMMAQQLVTMNPPPVAILGPQCSGAADMAAALTGLPIYQIPTISMNAGSATLSDKFTYPTFCRTVSTVALEAYDLAVAMLQFGFTQVSVIQSNDDFGQTFTTALQGYGVQFGIDISTVQINNAADDTTLTANDPDIVAAVNTAIATGYKTFVVYTADETQSLRIFERFHALGVSGSQQSAQGYSFLTGSLMADPTIATNMSTAALGCLIDNSSPAWVSPAYQATFQTAVNNWGLLANNTATNSSAPDMLDAMTTILRAIQQQLASNVTAAQDPLGALLGPTNGMQIYQRMIAQQFAGMDGYVQFDQNGDRVVGSSPQVIFSVQPNGQLPEIATVTLNNSLIPYQVSQWSQLNLMWPGKSLVIPSTPLTIRTLHNGDALGSSISYPLAILAAFICLTGGQLTSILVEQTVFEAGRKSRGITYMSAFTAITLTLIAIWCPHALLATTYSYSIPTPQAPVHTVLVPVTPTLELALPFVVIGLLPITACALCSILVISTKFKLVSQLGRVVGFHDSQTTENSVTTTSRSAHSHTATSTEAKGNAAVKYALNTGFVKQQYDANQANEENQMTGHPWETRKAQKTQDPSDMTLKQQVEVLKQRMSFRVVMGGILLSMAMISSKQFAFYGMVGINIHFVSQAYVEVIMSLLTTCLCVVIVAILFYAKIYRIIASFLMVVAVVVLEWCVPVYGCTSLEYYCPSGSNCVDQRYNALFLATVSTTVVTIVCCVLAALTAAILVNLLINKNQLSRNTLGLAVAKLQYTNQKYGAQLKEAEQQGKLKDRVLAQLRQTLSSISLMRPIYRPYAEDLLDVEPLYPKPLNAVDESLSPYTADVTPSAALHEILQQPYLLELLKDVASRRHTTESLTFYQDAVRYRNIGVVSKRYEIAKRMIATYIHVGATQQINVSSALRAAIEREYEGASHASCSADLFDSALTEVYTIIKNNEYAELQKTSSFHHAFQHIAIAG